jgi:hypothetical protein
MKAHLGFSLGHDLNMNKLWEPVQIKGKTYVLFFYFGIWLWSECKWVIRA